MYRPLPYGKKCIHKGKRRIINKQETCSRRRVVNSRYIHVCVCVLHVVCSVLVSACWLRFVTLPGCHRAPCTAPRQAGARHGTVRYGCIGKAFLGFPSCYVSYAPSEVRLYFGAWVVSKFCTLSFTVWLLPWLLLPPRRSSRPIGMTGSHPGPWLLSPRAPVRVASRRVELPPSTLVARLAARRNAATAHA